MQNSPHTILPRTAAVIQAGIARGLHTGIQIYVSLHGEVIVDSAITADSPGDDRNSQVHSDSLMLWLSAGKPLTAVAVLQLAEQGRVDLNAPVATLLPEFAAAGKETVTLRDLLTHTGGFRNVDAGWPHASWSESVSTICGAPLESGWEIGQSAGYHPSSSWYILGEIIARVSGQPFSQYLRIEICEPLEMTSTWNGMSPDQYANEQSRIASLSQRDRGETSLLPWHDEDHCAAPSPGANTRGPIRELGWFYEALLAGLRHDECPILSQESISILTQRHREGLFDETLRHKVDFGLGVILNSNRYGADTVPYGFGRFCSEGTFGHGGAQSSIGFADPEHDLVVAWAADVRAGEGQHQKRNREINSAIYEDLGLSG